MFSISLLKYVCGPLITLKLTEIFKSMSSRSVVINIKTESVSVETQLNSIYNVKELFRPI
jgi:hypothetical protein